jgi:hypothetical protein
MGQPQLEMHHLHAANDIVQRSAVDLNVSHRERVTFGDDALPVSPVVSRDGADLHPQSRSSPWLNVHASIATITQASRQSVTSLPAGIAMPPMTTSRVVTRGTA